ncbi:hypothetical protein AB0L40_16305 [Patulibacter sp. NPDC049589]|uniref:hypothetical protein n=1 Tax=Patulibacter sp. NPDC049589 TaxID=3154731 RepID=UPI0034444940
MVNTTHAGPQVAPDLGAAAQVIRLYVAVTAATIVALAVLSSASPRLATDDAWGHAAIVAAFAVLLPLRLRAARHGSRRALRALAVIAVVLLVVNVVEAALPGTFPDWMRVEMVAVAALMTLLAVVVRRGRPA